VQNTLCPYCNFRLLRQGNREPVLLVHLLAFRKSQVFGTCPKCKSEVALPFLSAPLFVLPTRRPA